MDDHHAPPESTRDLPPINRRIVVIGGFTQSLSERTGVERVWQHLRCRHEHPANGTRVDLLEWRADMTAYVRHCLRTGPRDPARLEVIVIAYSWGVGRGAIQLAEALQAEGVNIRRLVSCDGVYFSRWLPWRAMINRLFAPKIVIPSNVREVDSITQQTTRPRGHDLRAHVPDLTRITFHGHVRGVSHSDIDNSIEFLNLALEACRR